MRVPCRTIAPSSRALTLASATPRLMQRRYASETSTSTARRKQQLVVLGTGWGGYTFLKSLSYATLRQFDVKVVSPTTSFSFTPLLAQAACATLDFRSAIEPVHSNRWMEFHHAWCDTIDFHSNTIELTPASSPNFRPSDPLLSPTSPSPSSSPSTAATNAQEGKQISEAAERGGAQPESYKLHYDYLVMAVGSYNATFGTKGVKENALFLKDVSDARTIRWRVMGLFERANAQHHHYMALNPEHMTPEQEQQIRNLLSFIVVGGGPTGSEFAAELHDLIKEDLSRLYPNLAGYTSIRLLDAGSSILSSFDKGLAEYAMKKFARDGIAIQLKAKISSVARDGLWLTNPQTGNEEKVAAGMVVWSTGITTSPLIEALHGVAKEERTGKILTDETLNILIDSSAQEEGKVGGSVQKRPKHAVHEAEQVKSPSNSNSRDTSSPPLTALHNVFAIGDCASQTSRPILPATAQVATQKGSYLASLFNNHITTPLPNLSQELKQAPPFQWHDKGSMASIGSGKALIDSPVKKESGALAWVLWRSAYTIMSMSWRNRFLVPANWASNLLFGRDVGRF